MAHTHVGYLSANELPAKYMQQVQGSMMVTGFDQWIFGSYHPEIMGLHVVVNRDEKFIKSMQEKILICTELIKEKYEKLRLLQAA